VDDDLVRLGLHAEAENLGPDEALRRLEDQEGRVVLPTEAWACSRTDPNHRVMLSLLHAGILSCRDPPG
jgi:hypothetical protein